MAVQRREDELWVMGGETDWQTLLIIGIILVGVLLGPYELLLVVQKMWEQRRRDRIARGEDVTPKKLPWDVDD